MRLTNVTQMALPAGRVYSLELPAVDRGPGKPLPISFDQRRHVGEGDRAGSWMAIAARIPAGTTREDLARAWKAVVARHGTLRTAFRHVDGMMTLETVELGPGVWRHHPAADGQLTREIVRVVFDRTCRPFARPSHRLCVVEPDDTVTDRRPVVVLAGDHSHLDMWSLKVLVRDLLAALPDQRTGHSAPLSTAAPFAEHTALLESLPPSPDEVHLRWAEILDAAGGVMPRFPLPLGDLSSVRSEVVDVRDVLDAGELARIEEEASRAGIRLIVRAMSILTAVMARTASAPLRAVFPVHSRTEPRWHDAVGWFITNTVLECGDTDPAACAAAVRQAIELGSHPLGPILAPYGGMPASPGMFALSWLDARRLPVQLDPDLELQYVSAVVPTDGVMIWFIVTTTGLHLRCRYPDTPDARVSVSGWLDEIQRAFRVA